MVNARSELKKYFEQIFDDLNLKDNSKKISTIEPFTFIKVSRKDRHRQISTTYPLPIFTQGQSNLLATERVQAFPEFVVKKTATLQVPSLPLRSGHGP